MDNIAHFSDTGVVRVFPDLGYPTDGNERLPNNCIRNSNTSRSWGQAMDLHPLTIFFSSALQTMTYEFIPQTVVTPEDVAGPPRGVLPFTGSTYEASGDSFVPVLD